jgi:hypothetical protein
MEAQRPKLKRSANQKVPRGSFWPEAESLGRLGSATGCPGFLLNFEPGTSINDFRRRLGVTRRHHPTSRLLDELQLREQLLPQRLFRLQIQRAPQFVGGRLLLSIDAQGDGQAEVRFDKIGL